LSQSSGRLIPANVGLVVPWVLQALSEGALSRKDLLKYVIEIGKVQGFSVALDALKKVIVSCTKEKKIGRVRYGWWALANAATTPLSITRTKSIPAPKTVNAPQTRASRAIVFVGHGRSEAWRRLADYLEDHLGMEVVEFNRESMAGRTITERLEEMLTMVNFAVIVMTGEDETAMGTVRPRSNVIHETGLFQGKLGFRKAIILREEGCEDFSNIDGLIWLLFAKGKIEQTFVDLERALLREGVIKRRY